MSNPQALSVMPVYNNSSEMLGAELKSLLPMLQNNMLQDNRRTYPEARFKQYFAPFFLGIYEVPKEYNLLTTWVSEVGSYHIEVDVVGPDGTVLFTVPPIFNTNGMNINVNATHPMRFKGLENLLQAESMNNPSLAAVQYYNGIGHKLGSMFQGYSSDPNHTAKWLKIYEFYNVAPPVPENAVLHTNNPTTPPPSNGTWTDVGEFDFSPTFD